MKTQAERPNELVLRDWINISDNEFRLLSNYVYEKIGINLTEQKKNLLMSRLQKLLRLKKIKNFSDYYDFLISDKTGNALAELANNISTNHTFFYRENDHFKFFTDIVLPELSNRCVRNKNRDIRIWSAGCSTGEEPYTLVMLMMEFFGSDYSKYQAGILATDISDKVLNIASAGRYNSDKIHNLPDNLKKKYFRKLNNDEFEIDEIIKKEVTFRKFNLINDHFPFHKMFDAIFCRNVMIYFDEPTRETLVNKLYEFTVPGGYLFIGHSESLKRDRTPYQYIMPAVYQKINK